MASSSDRGRSLTPRGKSTLREPLLPSSGGGSGGSSEIIIPSSVETSTSTSYTSQSVEPESPPDTPVNESQLPRRRGILKNGAPIQSTVFVPRKPRRQRRHHRSPSFDKGHSRSPSFGAEVRHLRRSPSVEFRDGEQVLGFRVNRVQTATPKPRGPGGHGRQASLPFTPVGTLIHSATMQPRAPNIIPHSVKVQNKINRSKSTPGGNAPMDHATVNVQDELDHIDKAAAFVEQALEGRYMPVEITSHPDFVAATSAFLLYHQLGFLRYAAIYVLLLLPFWEKPTWCKGTGKNPCGDPKVVPLSGVTYMSDHLALGIEGICLMALGGFLFLQYKFLGMSACLMTRIPVYKGILLAVAFIDVIVTFLALHGFMGAPLVKITAYVRVLIAIVFSRSIRTCMRVTLKIVLKFIDIAVLLTMFVTLASWLGLVIFRDTDQGKIYFQNYGAALMQMFILLTTANNPDCWIPAYTDNRYAFFFFFFYLVTALYFLMNLVLSVIYSSYKSQMEVTVEKRVQARHKSLNAAFHLLDWRSEGWIDSKTFTHLYVAVHGYREGPMEERRAKEMFLELNKRGDFKIWSDEFQDLCDRIVAHRRADSAREMLVDEVTVHHHITKVVRHERFDDFITASLALTLAVVIAETLVTDPAVLKWLVLAEIAFAWLWMVEMVAKIVSHGWRDYWRVHIHRFDFVITIGLAACMIYYALPLDGSTSLGWMRYLMLLRTIRLAALFEWVPRWRYLAPTMLRLIPAVLPVLGLQFAVCTLFSLLGIHLFGGLVRADNPLLEGTNYLQAGYMPFNYNDFASAMATSFNLCVVNNWFIIMNGYAAVTGTMWSRAYFVVFWVVGVAFILNLVLAFVLDAFVDQMERVEEEERKLEEKRRARRLQHQRSIS